jgi:apolipoprotein N-acyltransferase
MGTLCLLSVASAILMTLAFPPFDLGILAWAGLSPLLFALRQRGALAAGGLAFLCGCGLGAGVFIWFRGIDSVSLGSFLLMLFLFSLYFLLFGLGYRLVSIYCEGWLISVAPALWVAMEYVRSNLFFLSWPWNLLGHTQYKYLHIIQIADFFGVYGLSFVLVAVNQVVSELPALFNKRWGKLADQSTLPFPPIRQVVSHVGGVVLAYTALFVYGSYRLSAPEPDQHLRVALVQANAVVRQNMSPPEQEQHLSAYRGLTLEAAQAKPDLVVWPSSSLPAAMSLSPLVRQKVTSLAREIGCYLLVGGAGYEKMKPRKERYLPFSNSEFLISPSGRLEGQYEKIRLLPFSEDLPLKGKINWPSWITTLKESFLAGDSLTLFHVSGASFGTPICWENLFPDFYRQFVLNGANLMVSVSNDAFFGLTAAPYQSLAMNVFRAVENRVAVVRATTTGVSAFIEPSGKIAEKVRDGNGKELFVSGFLVRDVPVSNRKTFYTLHGDLFAYIAIGVSVLALLASLYSLYSRKWVLANLRV